LREITGEEITAKDFRTWAATLLAAKVLRELDPCDSDARRKKAIVGAVKEVASHLGNTPAICRRSYIHPAIIDGYIDGTLLQGLADETLQRLDEDSNGMKPEEATVATFLRLRLGELAEEGCIA
jgi:DNA topoisomerase I